MQTEIWKDIPGFIGHYQVSNLGNVKSLERVTRNTYGRRYTVAEKILKIRTGTTGYHDVILSINGRKNSYRVHRLLMYSFTGESELEVNHKDGNKLNNILSNLEYVSSRENMNHRELILRNKKKYGVDFHKQTRKWRARLWVKCKCHYLGEFEDKEEAYQIFYNKYVESHGVAPW